MAAGLGKQIAQEMAGFAKNVYRGAVYGTKKADDTVVKAMAKSNTSKNLKYTKGQRSINGAPRKISKTDVKSNLRPLPQTTRGESVGGQIGDFVGSGARESVNAYKKMKPNEKSLKKAVQQGHKKADGSYDMKKIAGTAVGVGVAGRIATGGGLYRDRYGNVNVPGVPFI